MACLFGEEFCGETSKPLRVEVEGREHAQGERSDQAGCKLDSLLCAEQRPCVYFQTQVLAIVAHIPINGARAPVSDEVRQWPIVRIVSLPCNSFRPCRYSSRAINPICNSEEVMRTGQVEQTFDSCCDLLVRGAQPLADPSDLIGLLGAHALQRLKSLGEKVVTVQCRLDQTSKKQACRLGGSGGGARKRFVEQLCAAHQRCGRCDPYSSVEGRLDNEGFRMRSDLLEEILCRLEDARIGLHVEESMSPVGSRQLHWLPRGGGHKC